MSSKRKLQVHPKTTLLMFLPPNRRIVPALADYASKESRAAAYRLIRHVIVDIESIGKLRPFGIEWYIVR
jgi:hypothetical protein